MADLSGYERISAAQAAYVSQDVPDRDRKLIADVLRRFPVDNIDQWLELGGNCPYWANERRQRAAWVAEVTRQREQLATKSGTGKRGG